MESRSRNRCLPADLGRTLLSLAALQFSLSGCGWPFDCESERIEVSISATLQRGSEDETTAHGFAALAPGNIGEDYEAIKNVLVGGSYESPTWVTWTVTLDDTTAGWIAFTAGGPHQVGAVEPLGHASIGGWGLSSVPPTDQPGIHVETGDFVSSSASGTLEVLEVEPLAFRVDAELANAEEEPLRVQGDMRFALAVEDIACD